MYDRLHQRYFDNIKIDSQKTQNVKRKHEVVYFNCFDAYFGLGVRLRKGLNRVRKGSVRG